MIRLPLVDEDPLMRAGLAWMLGGTSDVEIVGEAADGAEAVRAGAGRGLAVARGWSNARIGDELHLSVPTVKAHVSRVLTKLGVGNRVQIALLARDADLT
ncbi:response regulator transcription factor [Actinosynnema pretiosum]|uniref:response regulator transcription factor n=1 Tax=Actinosynnema pretiosum TaxID=42197 RepID=UPI000AC9C33F|nr:LuxR C-terminal-related transcriptional regulator [Actinosynnema pretiosum]